MAGLGWRAQTGVGSDIVPRPAPLPASLTAAPSSSIRPGPRCAQVLPSAAAGDVRHSRCPHQSQSRGEVTPGTRTPGKKAKGCEPRWVATAGAPAPGVSPRLLSSLQPHPQFTGENANPGLWDWRTDTAVSPGRLHLGAEALADASSVGSGRRWLLRRPAQLSPHICSISSLFAVDGRCPG